MTPNRRPRTGVRRDGGVRRLNTDQVRYPGHDLSALEAASCSPAENPGGLRSVRDTGLALEGRLSRERRLKARQARSRAISLAAVAALVITAGIGWRFVSDSEASGSAMTSSVAVASAVPDALSAEELRDPTPLLAEYKGLQMRVPVPLDALTEVGFHQASNNFALSMTTELPTAGTDQSKADRSTGRDLSLQEAGPDAWLQGSVLRMWRSRPGQPDTAVDIGAPAGTDVYSPVTGTIVKIKEFQLYGKYPDFEIHIRPDGFEDIDCVLIHVGDLSVKAGDRVTAGVTRIAAVRLLSDRITHQLGEYTQDGGDHVHVQLNNAAHPEYKGLEGAIATDGS